MDVESAIAKANKLNLDIAHCNNINIYILFGQNYLMNAAHSMNAKFHLEIDVVVVQCKWFVCDRFLPITGQFVQLSCLELH